MMKLSVTTWQRMAAVQALNGQTGNIVALRKALKLLEILELGEEEQAAVGMREVAPGQWAWGDNERRWALEIADRELGAFLRRAAEAYGGWPVGHAAEVVDLCEQLGVEG